MSSMTFTDYLINGALVAIVILQIRGRRLSAVAFFLPVVLVSVAAISYLHGVPTAGNDLVLALIGAGVGLALGVGAGLTTRVFRRSDGAVVAKAGAVAAILWILGVGSRIAFEVYATNGGAASIARFSAHHNITTVQAWVTGLILMALVEVISRTAVLGGKFLRLGGVAPSSGSRVVSSPRGGHRERGRPDGLGLCSELEGARWCHFGDGGPLGGLPPLAHLPPASRDHRTSHHGGRWPLTSARGCGPSARPICSSCWSESRDSRSSCGELPASCAPDRPGRRSRPWFCWWFCRWRGFWCGRRSPLPLA
ncbi:MAG: hypothetical protein ACRDYC_00660 [Acidimicrobiales bacterium]